MKIAIIAHLKYPIAEPFSGGLEMHTHILAERLAARGHAVTLFAAEGSRFAAEGSSGAYLHTVCRPTSTDDDPVDGSKIYALEHEAYSTVVTDIGGGDFDIVHCNALHYLPLQEAASIGLPMVCVLHTPPFDPLDVAVRAAANVNLVSVSRSLRRQWGNIRASIIENGIDLTRFPFTATADAERFAVWSGRVVPEKGLHLAIDAAAGAGLPLAIAGPVIDRAYWDAEIAPRLGGSVTYLGHLTQVDLAAVIGRASVCLCTPRWEEPFGLVVAESLACGTPVAAFARGALPDILDERCGALAPADDVPALSRAILRCLTLERRACRDRAEDFYDADLMIDRYEDLYADMLAVKRRRGATARRELLDGADVD